MKLFLVRHGETDANRILGHGVSGPMHDEPVVYVRGGDTDVPLNVYGRNHASDAAMNLPDHIDALYTSPLIRAKETAEIIALAKQMDPATIIVRDELREYFQGSFEGLTTEEKLERLGGKKLWGSAMTCTYDYTPWGGESAAMVRARVSLFINELAATHTGKTIVCATSGGVIRMVYNIFFAEKAPGLTKHMNIKNGSVHEFVV